MTTFLARSAGNGTGVKARHKVQHRSRIRWAVQFKVGSKPAG